MSDACEQMLDTVLKRLNENEKQNTELFYRMDELCARSDKNTDTMMTLVNEYRTHADTMLSECIANWTEMMKMLAFQQDMLASLQKTNDSVAITLNDVASTLKQCCHSPDSHPPQSGENVTGYRKLSQEEVAAMNKLKGLSKQFLQALTDIQADILPKDKTLSETSGAYRSAALAKTQMQEACMWACRSVARPANDC